MASQGVGFEVEAVPELADARLKSLYAYWCELAAAAGGLPALPSFDPLRAAVLLPNIWIVEVDPSSHRLRMRLAGERINAIYRRNVGGRFFADIFVPAELSAVVARYSRALGEPALFRAVGAVYSAAGRLCAGERLCLPMLGRSGRTDTLLGATVYRDRMGETASVLVTGDTAQFHRVRAANHAAIEIAGG